MVGILNRTSGFFKAGLSRRMQYGNDNVPGSPSRVLFEGADEGPKVRRRARYSEYYYQYLGRQALERGNSFVS